MDIRLAHLSDLHFGTKFDLALWAAVKHEVIGFKPHLLVASGDMVDEPNPLHLLAAKCELRDFAAEAGAKLVVVPGNHDVYAKGLYSRIFSPRRDWFERIFFNDDTGAAETAAEREYGAPLGFSERYRKKPARTEGLGRRLGYAAGFIRTFEQLLPAHRKQGLVDRPEGIDVLLAKLDSNMPGQAIGFATGRVDDRELVALRTELGQVKQAYLLRVAIVHHHVLPIAFTGGQIIDAEPLMVLHNAGTVLDILAEHRFDLVLHGHKHVPQFARLDLSPSDAIGYSMAVAAAGSASLTATNNDRANCFNLVTVAGNGRITIESLRYGSARGPSREESNRNRSVYEEPLAVVKRRAFTRARERHTLHSLSRTQSFEITPTGDLLTTATLKGLRTKSPTSINERDHAISLTDDSWFVEELLRLDEVSDAGIALRPAPPPPEQRAPSVRRFAIGFPDGALTGTGASYRVTYACGNSVNMTLWECVERLGPHPRRQDWDKGWVAFALNHPVEDLLVTLKLPPGFAAIEPSLNCRRIEGYPSYETNAGGEAVFSNDREWVEDLTMTTFETPGLRYDRASAEWRLHIERPLVGYSYRLMWRAPGQEPDPEIEGEVRAQRRMLLDQVARAGLDPAGWPTTAADAFVVLSEGLRRLLERGGGNDECGVELFVYDRSKLALRPVLSRRSWMPPMRPDFEIPLGRGIAGVAFQQGRDIPWAQATAVSPFVRPIPYTDGVGHADVEMRTILAVPIFHRSQASLDSPPPPWSCIGVVSFGSSSEWTEVLGMLKPSPDKATIDLLRGVRGLAHAAVNDILASLSGSIR